MKKWRKFEILFKNDLEIKLIEKLLVFYSEENTDLFDKKIIKT